MRSKEQGLDDADCNEAMPRRGVGKGTVLRSMERAVQSKHYAAAAEIDPELARAYVEAARRRKQRKNGRRRNP